MSLKHFEILNEIGKGSYSIVYKVKRLQDNKIYALKQVKMHALSQKEKQNALNEVHILAGVNHPNIVGYRDAFFDPQTGFLWQILCSLIMDYSDNGDLYQKIVQQQKKGRYFSENFIWSVLIQVVKGLKALHDQNILHRDIKSANIFLQQDGTIRLGDLNVSKVAQNGFLYTQTGTPYYASPEVWRDQPYTTKSDIWSLGCIIYELICLKPPFRAENMQGLYKKVIKGQYKRLPYNFSRDLNEIVSTMITVDYKKRPSCGQILSHPLVIRRMRNQSAEQENDSRVILNSKDIKQLPGPNYNDEIINSTEKYSSRNNRALPKLPIRNSLTTRNSIVTRDSSASILSSKVQNRNVSDSPSVKPYRRIIRNDYSDRRKSPYRLDASKLLPISSKCNLSANESSSQSYARRRYGEKG